MLELQENRTCLSPIKDWDTEDQKGGGHSLCHIPW